MFLLRTQVELDGGDGDDEIALNLVNSTGLDVKLRPQFAERFRLGRKPPASRSSWT
jgi:hypothetical protein